jgi:hypothetical protein
LWREEPDDSKNDEKPKTALELLFDLSESDAKRCRPVMKPFNLTEEWHTWTHRYFPVLFRREVFVLLCVRKRLRWMSRDVLTLLIRALAAAHRDMPKSIAWTLPIDPFLINRAPPLAWPFPMPPGPGGVLYPLNPGHVNPHPPLLPNAYPHPPYPLGGFQANYMG